MYAILKDFAGPVIALGGITVTGYFACAGLRTFDRWKQEKLEEKRIDVAIDALAIGVESRHVFDYIRSRFRTGDMKSGDDQGFYAVLKRNQAQQPFFDKVLALEPKFVAVFGPDKEKIFERLFSARQQVIVTAEALIEDYNFQLEPANKESREQRVKWHKQIFASRQTVDPEDEVGKLLQQFRGEIEELCRPIVDRSFKVVASTWRWR